MRTIWMTLRADARTRWRAWVALGLVFGLGAGGAIAAAAGARRTDTAYPRFVRAQNAFDAVSGGGGSGTFAERFAALKQHPLAEQAIELITIGAEITIPATGGRRERVVSFPDILLGTDPSGRSPYEINRAKVLEGRLPDRSRVDQVSVPFTVADRYGIKVGDAIEIGVGFDLFNPGPSGFPGPMEHVRARVVGIHAAPGDFETVGQAQFFMVYATPAVYEKYAAILPQFGRDRDIDELVADTRSLGFKLKGGPSRAVAFKQAVERDLAIDVPIIEPVVTSGVQKTIRLYTVALWLVAALVAVATLAVVGQTLARQQALEAADYPTLRAVGVSRGQLVGLALTRAVLTAVLAAIVATVVAYLVSPLTPIGPARVAEPDPGFAFDATVIGIGGALVILLVPLITLIPSLRSARSAGRAERVGAAQPSWLVRQATRLSGAPATGAGVRMALEPGRGRTAVPVRSTIVAIALGVAAVTASITAGNSLGHLIATPQLTGFTYDAILPEAFGEGLETDEARVAKLRTLPFIDRVALGTAVNVVIGGADSFLIALQDHAAIGYAIIDGRAPAASVQRGLPEIALGPATMRRLRLQLGDTVAFQHPPAREESEEIQEGPLLEQEKPTQRAVIVGTAAVPPVPWAATEPGEGGVISAESVERFRLGSQAGCCFVTFKPGTDLTEASRSLQRSGFETSLRTKRADMVTLERISQLPVVLSAIFAVIGAAALAHILVTAVRRRRRDLAILKTLGFVKSQVQAAIAWQVSTIAVLSLLVGIPVGIALGRWGWGLIADQFGVVPVALAPAALIALLIPIALVLGNVVAALPGRSAARTQPALVLRAE